MQPTDHPFLYAGFLLLTLGTLFWFYRLTGRRRSVLAVGLGWLLLTALLAGSGFFRVTDVVPPRLAYLMVPALIGGLVVGFGRAGRDLRRAASLERLHYFHAVRILVEVVFLHGLYGLGYVARELTYEGYNVDLLVGLTGPLVGYLVFRRGWLPRWAATGWNLMGIAVLLSTVAVAVLSAPSPYQQFSLQQPTVAILYFPYVWLPALVVPLMFWAHFMALRKLRE